MSHWALPAHVNPVLPLTDNRRHSTEPPGTRRLRLQPITENRQLATAPYHMNWNAMRMATAIPMRLSPAMRPEATGTV